MNRLANWLWLFVKFAVVGCDAAPSSSFKRENISTEAFNGVCTNKISLFDQPSEYREYIQWMRHSEVFSLSKKLLLNLRKYVIYCRRCSLSGASGESVFSFCAMQSWNRHFKGMQADFSYKYRENKIVFIVE